MQNKFGVLICIKLIQKKKQKEYIRASTIVIANLRICMYMGSDRVWVRAPIIFSLNILKSIYCIFFLFLMFYLFKGVF